MKHAFDASGIGLGLLLLGVFAAAPASAAEGDLDTTFGSGGKVVTSFDIARSVAIQKDGKIVTAGYGEGSTSAITGLDFALVRHNTDGSLDTSFGSGGKVTTDFSDTRGTSTDAAYAVAIQADGKIVAAGYANGMSDFAVARYNTDGSLDSAFATGGKFTSYSINTPSYYFARGSATALAIQSDGKIVVVGYIYNSPQHLSSNQHDFVVMRFNTNGALDSTFASGGVKVTAIGDGDDFDYAYAVAIQSDGKIVAAGNARVSTYNYSLALARFNANGGLDTTFGSGGKLTTNIGSSSTSAAHGIAIQADGKIVIAGVKEIYYMVLARYTTSGILDTTFGTGGLVTTTSYDTAYGVALQSDGKIIAAGATSGKFAAFRYLGTAVAASATTQADCVFAWAESAYPAYFSPAGATSSSALDYYYRYYSASTSYLASASRDGNLYYFGPLSQNTLLSLGAMSQWLVSTGCN